MEKRRAHYDLSAIIDDVRKLRAAAFTKTALDGGRKMGFTSAEMVEIVCGLSSKQLYKSMTTNADSTVWQDVYRAKTIRGTAYIKVTRREYGPPVIQFKEL
jgi:motility quorum-sensing regulator / GCU-specific mRNA interferase toxin